MVDRKKHSNEEELLCDEERGISIKCINENNFDHSKCELAYLNYKECRKFWGEVVRQRRRNNIMPATPGHEERLEIKNYYLKTGKFSFKAH